MRHGGMVYIGTRSSNTFDHDLVRSAFWIGVSAVGAPWLLPSLLLAPIARSIVRLGR